MTLNDVPVNERYAFSVTVASQYFGIGENKLRKIVCENKDADFILWNGTRPLIKRKAFEKYLDGINAI